MPQAARSWTCKPFLILAGLAGLVLVLPEGTVGPGNLFNPRKVVSVVLALTSIQWGGVLLFRILGARIGAVLSGFFGGLISSTATTAALARASHRHVSVAEVTRELLVYLSATVAMLLEGAAVFYLGTRDVHYPILIVFFGPGLVAAGLIYFKSRSGFTSQSDFKEGHYEFLPILKLSAFIVGILALSKLLEGLLGQSGLLVLTFVVSLFEIHGSFIANMQLHDSGSFDARMLGTLAVVSVCASFLSKLFLIHTLGGKGLKTGARRITAALVMALGVSWLIFLALI